MDLACAAPRFGRAVLTLTAAATIAVCPVAPLALAPADSGQSAHTVPIYVFARLAHDVGHNDWAFQGRVEGLIAWVASYVALAVFWAVIALWIRARVRRGAGGAGAAGRDGAGAADGLWWRVLIAALAAQAAAGCLTFGAGALAEWTSWAADPVLLRVADLGSPWWSCVAVCVLVARREHDRTALLASAGYASLLVILLLVPLPVPDLVRALALAVPAAVPALLGSGSPGPEPLPSDVATPDAAAAG